MILDYLKENVLVTDGAMGTYYSQLTNNKFRFSELANINEPDIIRTIHKEYIDSGAGFIRTNTFSANTVTLNMSQEQVKEIIKKGYKIAVEAVGDKEVFIAADIGPIPQTRQNDLEIKPERILEEYKFIVDVFLGMGADLFVFETFSCLDYLKEVIEYIKNRNEFAFILTQFALTTDGFTRKGIGIDTLIKKIKEIGLVDAYGFNCGVGPTHLFNILKKKELDFEQIISVLPNAGYPEIKNERTVYNNNPEYFANKIMDIKNLGAKIIGGCCGTTPYHIKEIVQNLRQKTDRPNITVEKREKETTAKKQLKNKFQEKMQKSKFLLAVEIDPPFDTTLEKVIKGAAAYKENGFDIITIADSPMARVRADSITIAAKIQREVGIETLPHICCRDKNLVALRASLLGAHIEGIRNILAVTGDPIPEADKGEVKSVFNVNSFNLMKLISEMNKGVFYEEQLNIGGALNLNALNKEKEIARMKRKVEMGAAFFLTQPIFSDQTIEFLSKWKRDSNIKILGGILPIVTYRNALFINNELSGMDIPKEFVERFDNNMSREEAEEVGVELAGEIASKTKDYLDGFYFMTPFNRYTMVNKIIDRLDL